MCKILLLFLFLSISLNVFSQKQTFSAKDGTSVDIEILSANADDLKKTSIYMGVFYNEGLQILGVSHHEPEKYYINGMLGFFGGTIDGNYIISSKLKDDEIAQTVKATGNSRFLTKYYAVIPVKKRISYAIHGGITYLDESIFLTEPLNATDEILMRRLGVYGGVSLLRSKFVSLKIFNSAKKAQGTAISRLNADIVGNVLRGIAGVYEGESSANDLIRLIVFRVYYDGKATLWSRNGRISFNYMLGVGTGHNKNRSTITAIVGLGVGYNFN